MTKKKVLAQVVSQEQIATGIFDLRLKTDLAEGVNPGQFIGIYPPDSSLILPRPISICSADKEEQILRLCYRAVGKGTSEMTLFSEGDQMAILGLLGNGFPVEAAKGKRALLMGGGIGVPPILGLAQELKKPENGAQDIQIVMGYRNAETFLSEEFAACGTLSVATEDGSVGTKGNVMDAIRENGIEADVIYACGPMPMLRAIRAYAMEHQIPAYISLEERMACGVGACLGCVCKTTHKDEHSQVNNARICTDGPVFLAGDVEI